MQDLPFWKAILITLAILVLAAAYFFVTSLLGLNDPWVAFVAVTMWSAIGMKLEQAPGVFIGGALGLVISWSISALPDIYGDLALVIPIAAIVLAIACKIKEMLPLICNFGLFIFLTLGSADIVVKEGMQLAYVDDLAFGTICFWIVPWLVVRLRSEATTQDWDKKKGLRDRVAPETD